MAGDLIKDEWIGTVSSWRGVVGSLPTRFSTTSRKFRKFTIYNKHPSYSMYVGEYHSSPASFNASANLLAPGWGYALEYIDIYTLGYNLYAGAYASFQWIGTL